jgi:hypothetical protein
MERIVWKENRLILEIPTEAAAERVALVEDLLEKLAA